MKVVKATLKALLIFVIITVGLVILLRCMGCGSQKSTIEQLRYNLNDERAAREQAEEQVAQLKEELDKKTQQVNAKEQQEASTKGDNSIYLQVKFAMDGNFYVDANENVFYKDVTCTKVVKTPRFMSAVIDENINAPNGFVVNALRLDNGNICYCPSNTSVYLVTETEWEEYLAEQEAN